MDEIAGKVVFLIIGAVVSFAIMKFLNRDQDSLKSFGELMAEKFNGLSKDMVNINNTIKDINQDKKEDKKDAEEIKVSVIKLQSQWHQLSQAIADVDTSAQTSNKHNREIFDLYKQHIESQNKVIDGLLKKH
jgi:predicted RNase H-like nuclease (RuvC/YqgF family)